MEENKETPTTPEDEETKQKEKPASKESPPPGGEEKSSSGLDPNKSSRNISYISRTRPKFSCFSQLFTGNYWWDNFLCHRKGK